MAQRNLTATLKAEFLKHHLALIALVEIEFVSSTERYWTGYGPLSWNGQTWTGTGTLGSISTITESSDIAANGISLALSGIPTELVGKCLDEIRPDKRVKVWYGALDSNGQVVVDPYLSFQGFCDVPTIEDNGETYTISLTCEPRWLDRLARVWRYTAQDQEHLSPGDTGFRFLKDLDKPTYWGNRPVFSPGDSYATCFNASVTVRTPEGFVAFGSLPREFRAVNETGTHPAVLLTHDFRGWMVRIAGDDLVTLDHPMRLGSEWVDAQVKYDGHEQVWFEGTVYNLHVLSEHDADHHYILGNGDIAHNKIAGKPGRDEL